MKNLVNHSLPCFHQKCGLQVLRIRQLIYITMTRYDTVNQELKVSQKLKAESQLLGPQRSLCKRRKKNKFIRRVYQNYCDLSLYGCTVCSIQQHSTLTWSLFITYWTRPNWAYFVENLSYSGCLNRTITCNPWQAKSKTRTPRENINKCADVGDHMVGEEDRC